MANYPQRMNKSMMNSPYYQGYSQGGGRRAPVQSNSFFVPGSSSMPRANYPGRNAPVQVPGPYSRAVLPPASTASVLTPKQIKKLERQKSREKDYFFIMRKGACFFIFLLCLLTLVVVGGGIATSFFNLPEPIGGYADMATSIFTQPDNTPLDERGEDYVATTTYIKSNDPVFGIVRALTKSFLPLDILKSDFYDGALTYLNEQNDPSDTMLPIAKIIFQYVAPALLIIALISVIVILFKSLFALAGKRIYRGFGLAAIIMLLSGAALAVAGLIGLGYLSGAPAYMEDGTLVSILDFSKLISFFTATFTGAPATAPDLTIDAAPLALEAGIGLLALLGLSLLILFFSFFARKKVPYSIFDK